MKPIQRVILGLIVAVAVSHPAMGQNSPQVEFNDITQTVVKMSMQEGVTVDDVTTAMNAKAVELNFKMVGRQKVHEEIRARGLESPHLEILQFCDPEDAVEMVRLNPLYAAYMPCRIALVEDDGGKFWLLMLNLDMLINAAVLPADLQAVAIRVNQAMLAIMTAGATAQIGEF